MSQYVSTENEEMEQVATNLGWSEFCEWVATLDVEDCPSLHHLCTFGYDNDPEDIPGEIAAALEASPPPDDVRSTADGLAAFCEAHADADIVIVSNGMTADGGGDGDDDDNEE